MSRVVEPGMLVTIRGHDIGRRGNWKAAGTDLWRVFRISSAPSYRSGWCVHLWPADPADLASTRKHPFKVDLGLVDVHHHPT